MGEYWLHPSSSSSGYSRHHLVWKQCKISHKAAALSAQPSSFPRRSTAWASPPRERERHREREKRAAAGETAHSLSDHNPAVSFTHIQSHTHTQGCLYRSVICYFRPSLLRCHEVFPQL